MHVYAATVAVYILLILILPRTNPMMSDMAVTPAQYQALLLVIALPVISIWFAAVYGYTKLRDYANSIRRTPESRSFNQLADGAAWLAWSLPASAILTMIMSVLAHTYPGFRSPAIILTNYTYLLLTFVGLLIMGNAARSLVTNAHVNFSTMTARSLIVLFITAGVLYCYSIFSSFDSSSLAANDNVFHLPLGVVIVTLVIPNLFAWFTGTVAIYELHAYKNKVKGLFYKQSLHLLISGLTAVIVSAIMMQYLNSVVPLANQGLLSYRLVLNLIIGAGAGIGFILIAMGATRLKRIEEV